LIAEVISKALLPLALGKSSIRRIEIDTLVTMEVIVM
jgi:hypothetical protein